MKVLEQRQGAVTVLRPSGPLVASEAEAFKARVLEALGESRGRFVLDVSDIAFVDSAGLESLLDVTEGAGGGQGLKICGANETLRQVLELTGLARLFEHFEDANTAVRSFL
jgi:anti-anti-sigma factor